MGDENTPGINGTVFKIELEEEWNKRPITFKILPRPGGSPINNLDEFIGKKPDEYNPGSILEIEYKFGSINHKELFMIGRSTLSNLIIDLKTGFVTNINSDQFGKNFCNIINIIVKKET
jgi:hypothetical protein